MKSVSALILSVLTLGSGLARAQDVGAAPQTANAQALPPPYAAPAQLPSPPPEQLPAPPQEQVQQAEAAPQEVQQDPPTGQWVYTQQYGWVWMAYGDQYTYAPTQEGVYPQAYVYYPSYGWTWLAAPWVFGWGVSPYWGVYGPAHFGWYGRLAAGGWRGYNGAYGIRAGSGGYGYRGGYVARPGYGGFSGGSHVGGSIGGGFHGGGGFRGGGGFHGGGGHGHR
ncbi:MAG TPA: hypothetical protein VHL80_15980 [Polyangia bacterium]|nr:hypothetical protein [Polyangia bacterium]